MRFYSIQPSELENMTLDSVNELAISMVKIKAREQLDKLEIVTYPKLKDERARKKVRRRLKDDLNYGEEKKAMTAKEIARMLTDG